MNEIRFLEIMGKIDDDLIGCAMSDKKTNQKTSHVITKRNICAFGTVAAVAVITVGSAAFYGTHKPSELLSDNSFVMTDDSEEHTPENTNDDTMIVASETTIHDQKSTTSAVTTAVRSTHSLDSGEYENTDIVSVSENSEQMTEAEVKTSSSKDSNSASTTENHTTQAVTQTEIPVQSLEKAQSLHPDESVTTILLPVQTTKEEPSDFEYIPYGVHTNLDVSYEEAKTRFRHAVSECTRSGFLGYKIGIVSQNGDINSNKAYCLDLTYEFTNGIVSIIDQDRMVGSRSTCGTEQYDYLGRLFMNETFINDEQITIGYYPDGDNGLAYVAVFDRSVDIYEIMDIIISLEV